MSSSSAGSGRVQRREVSLQHRKQISRQFSSGQTRNIVSRYDAYTYALRVAYLAHLLTPKARRLQHVTAPKKPPTQRNASAVTDLVKDFSIVRDSKSTRFPSGFMAELDKRITGILVGKEKMPEYAEPLVKRTFAVFLNEFKKPAFRKSMETDRRVEDLLLIFFSNATKELQKGKAPEDDSWKLMVDRHVALFVRLISSTLKSNDWNRDRPELTTRLQTLETKLLLHDQDLSHNHDNGAGTTTMVDVPLSQNVKDMPLVLVVANTFGKTLPQVQAELDEQKDFWTAKAALQDLKMYQTNLSLNTKRTLRSDDFDTEEAFDAWKKQEIPELSQMMLAILQSNMDLARSAPGMLPHLKAQNGGTNGSSNDTEYAEHLNKLPDQDASSSYTIDQPVDMSALSLGGDFDNTANGDDGEPYMFIPPEPRVYFRALLKEALSHELQDPALQSSEQAHDLVSPRLLSRKSTELLNEVGTRWRIPHISRLILLLDVVREKLVDHELDLDSLDAAFNYVKEPSTDKKRPDVATLFDWTKWTLADYTLHKQVLQSVYDTLQRDLFEQLLNCYESKPPQIGPVMAVLEAHIYDDPLFSRPANEMQNFSEQLRKSLSERALHHYQSIHEKEITQHGSKAEFFHVIQLGKAVLKFADKIQKRYRKNPELMGVEPYAVLVQTVLPHLGPDIREQITTILDQAKTTSEEIPVQDGFDLYKEMVEIRRLHSEALPNEPFNFHVEGLLSTFVWRWIATMDENMIKWVEGAVMQDTFAVRIENPNDIPDDDERHSVSAIDIFRSFNQSIDQIMALEWDDDLQYAKFMTALSKAVGMGIQKYCDMLEAWFVKEMDRLTPAQEAALVQSRQEKWMQLAKDAMSTKERVEPFHFLPESFVKLNNIEYAMLQLDKIEKEMNVDACVEVLKKNEPPLQSKRVRKNEKFVFTIKIIEAEDLRACDPNGLSDPYVVLGDEHQKRLAKTRIIYGDLNPRWDETVDITTTGLLSITATIWDWDVLGDHDCCGRTTIKLDPAHFSDYLPREYWLDLDTQGRLLVRITMEGEKDDIQFYFGKAFRGLKRTQRDMTRKITDKLSAYLHYCLSRRVLKSLTKQAISINTVSNFFNRGQVQAEGRKPPEIEISNSLKPLYAYLDDNFAIMQQTLTSSSMITVMTRVWKEVLTTIESLLVPPLSDKPSAQRQLNEYELDTVFKWLRSLFDFFHAVDDETGEANGVPLDVLKSPKYHDLQNLNFFYYEPTDTLIRTSERMAVATADRAKPAPSRLSAPALGLHVPSTASRRSKSILLSRNLGTMKKAKADKRAEAQAEPSDDMILRILRMRPEAARYLRDRARQRERLAAAAAAEFIVSQSLQAGVLRKQAGVQRGGRANVVPAAQR